MLGKVLAVCKNSGDSIDLLRKNTLSILPETMLSELVAKLP